MKKKTIEKLNKINRKFYQLNAESFSSTRQSPWGGWKRLISQLPITNYRLSVLDVGCGNGRFLKFLLDKVASKNKKLRINYFGIDFSEELLNYAREDFKDIPKKHNVSFRQVDLLKKGALVDIEKKFDVVVAIALLHHIPGYDNRFRILKELCHLLNVNGQLFISLWQYKKSKKFKQLIASPKRVEEVLGETAVDLEEDDHLLDWNRTKVYRYCHNFSDKEIKEVKKQLFATGYKLLAEYSADGKEGNLNRYFILSKSK